MEKENHGTSSGGWITIGILFDVVKSILVAGYIIYRMLH